MPPHVVFIEEQLWTKIENVMKEISQCAKYRVRITSVKEAETELRKKSPTSLNVCLANCIIPKQPAGGQREVFAKVLYKWGCLGLPAGSCEQVNDTGCSDAAGFAQECQVWGQPYCMTARHVCPFPYPDSKWQHRNRSSQCASFLLHDTDSKDGLTSLLKWRLAELIYTSKPLPVTPWTLLELPEFKSVSEASCTLARDSDCRAFSHHLKTFCFLLICQQTKWGSGTFYMQCANISL